MLLMQLYVALFVLIIAGIFTKFGKRINFIKKLPIDKDFTNSRLFFIIVFGLVFLITVLRGFDVGVDYPTYIGISEKLASVPFDKIWHQPGIYMEPILLILIKFCSSLHFDLIPFVSITTAFVLFIYYKEYRRDSSIVWLSIFLLLIFGSYFTIFNGIAQFVVCTIMFGAASYIYKGNFKKFLIIVIIAAMFHKTALFMIPMYFILRHKVSDQTHRKAGMIVLLILIVSFILIYLQQMLTDLTPLLFPEYNHKGLDEFDTAYTMTVLRPSLIMLFVIINRKYINLKDMKERVWFNASIFNLVMTVLSLQFGPMQRFSYFLLPYTTLLIPRIITKMPTKRKRAFWISLIVIILILYIILTCSVKDLGYTFLWQK